MGLCRKVNTSCAELRDAENLGWRQNGLTADDVATLAMILQINRLPRLQRLRLSDNGFGDGHAGVVRGPRPHILALPLGLGNNNFGPAGAEALGAALCRGALPNLVPAAFNPIGNQGAATLAAPLRKLPTLKRLLLTRCEIGDKGLASLVANLGKDDFKALETLFLGDNQITDAGMTTLVAVLDAGRLPRLVCDQAFGRFFVQHNRASASAVQAVEDALAKRSQ